uniref:TIL domain-containing protein n=1 Tax=Stomoxys calcitrans TaxID=35570 RepID=A0A1I8PH24_STOCA
MAKFFLFAFLAFLSVTVQAARFPIPSCGPNEEFTTCGFACPLTCDNPLERGICTFNCYIGCQCKTNFVRHSNGHCVRPEEC